VSPIEQGALIGLLLLVLLATGMPIAFALGLTAVLGLVGFEGVDTLGVAAQTLFAHLNDFALASIAMFIFMGATVASSPAGRDLYRALDRWLWRVPGGLIIANIGACAVFAALSGSSPATAAAIGKMGIPEMRARGVPADLATGVIAAGGTLGILIPPSVTMIVYGIATETSIGRLFLAGVVPGILLATLFAGWTLFACWRHGWTFRARTTPYSWREKLDVLPRVLPFLAVVVGVLYVLYGGVATPSEAAGVGAALCLLLVVAVYRLRDPRRLWQILADSTKESVMILLIISTSGLFSYMLSYLYITQSIAEWIAELDVNRWVLLAIINIFLLVAGFFLPPVAVIVMTAPILLPIVTEAGFDPYWFAVVLTINMEIGLITPPVGLNLYVINGIAPDVPLHEVLRGSLPYVLIMVFSIVLLALFPGLATWLPDLLMGPALFG